MAGTTPPKTPSLIFNATTWANYAIIAITTEANIIAALHTADPSSMPARNRRARSPPGVTPAMPGSMCCVLRPDGP
jgi:hypothetical protein